MAEHWHPTFDEALAYLAANLDDTLADIRDLRAAMALSNDAREVVDEYQSRRLLRRVDEEAVSN